MAKQLTSLTIFISGSSEAEAEKAALRTVLADLGEILEKTHKITLRLIGWPDTVRPGVGADPQGVINQQIGDTYDIYVGVLGSRFGQATPRAGSGTEEEFRRALDRFRRETSSVRVLIYFNRAARDLFNVDLEQLQKVRNFRDDLSPQGVLYCDFKDTAEFADLVRKHLHSLIVEEWKDGRWEITAVEATQVVKIADSQTSTPAEVLDEQTQNPDIAADDEEDLGLLDLMEEFQRAAGAVKEILERFGGHTESVGRKFELRALQLNELVEKTRQTVHAAGNRAKQQYVAQAKDVANQSADDLDQYVSDTATDLQMFKVENRAMFEHLSRALAVQREFTMPAERRDEDREALQSLVDILITSQGQTTRFQVSVSGLPAFTTKVRRARKRASAMLGELIAELQFSIQESNRILGGIPPQ